MNKEITTESGAAEKDVWTTPILKKMDIEETANGTTGLTDGEDPGS